MDKEITDIDNINESLAVINLGKRTAKMASAVFMAKIFTFLVVGFAFVIVARILGPSTYGIYTLAIAVPGLFTAFGDFGFSTSIIKFLSEYIAKKEKDKIIQLIKNVFIILLIGTGTLTALAFIFSGPIATYLFKEPSYTQIFEVGSLLVILGVFFNVFNSVLIGLGLNKKLAYTIIIQVSAQATTSISLALLGFGAYAPLLGTIFGFIFGLSACLFYIKKSFNIPLNLIGVSRKKWWHLLKFSSPLGLSGGIGNLVTNIAIMSLGVYSTSFVIGNFGVSNKLSTMFDLIIGSIGVASLSLFSFASSNSENKLENIEKYYNYTIFFTFLVITPIIFLIVLLAKPVSYIAFGSNYSLAPLYITVMAIGVFLYILNSYSSNLIISTGKVNKILLYSIIISFIELILIPLLIPAMNGFGLSLILFIIAPLISIILYLWYIVRILKISANFYKIFKVLISGIISAIFIIPLIILLNTNFIILLIAAIIEQIIIYPIIISLTKTINLQLINQIKEIVSDIPIINILFLWFSKYILIFIH
ncbi:MAG: oligosaccharide flippase family protein [Candidatus Micrarchaeia archaeon]